MKVGKASQLFTLLLVFTACLPVHRAYRHHCNRNPQVLTLNKDATVSTFDAELTPRLLEEPDGLKPLKCEWKIQFDREYHGSQLILIAETDESRKELDQEKHLNRSDLLFGWGRADIAVTSGTFHVHPLNSGETLFVESYWDPKTQLNTQWNLRLLIPPAGSCPTSSESSRWFSYRGNCYTVSESLQGAAAAINSTGGDAQLATFGSKTEFNNFVVNNKDELDLYKPVRVGMFYRAADGALLALDRSEGDGCRLKNIPMSHRIQLPAANTVNDSVVCASLRVDFKFKRQVIEFANCNNLLPSLLTFPMTAGNGRANYNCSLDRILTKLAKQPIKQPTKKARIIITTFFSSISSPKVAAIGHYYWIIIASIGTVMLGRVFTS